MRVVFLPGAVLLLSLCGGCHAVTPDCCALGFGDVAPTNDSSFCNEEGMDDCCTSFYLDLLNTSVHTRIKENLVKEYKDGLDVSISTLQQLTDYFDDGSFERDLLKVLTSSDSMKSDSNLLSGIDMPDACRLVSKELIRTLSETQYRSDEISESERRCINSKTSEVIGREPLATASSELVQLYRYTLGAAKKILTFMASQTNELNEASVSTACVNGFIQTAYCRQCVERTPPLCFNTCNALLRGCYSPYYTVLNGEFEELWVAVKNVTKRADRAVDAILSNTSKLVSELTSTIERECGVMPQNILDYTGDRTYEIPFLILYALFEISGPFQYGETHLEMCEASVDENACNEVTQGPQIIGCAVQDSDQLKNDTYTSDPGAMSTSQCDCFDGLVFTKDWGTTITFDNNDIHSQGYNPAFMPPLVVDDLEEDVFMIRQRGNPVQDFLSSDDYTALAAATLHDKDSVMCVDENTADPVTDNGPAVMVTSCVLLVPTMLLASFLV
jgi:hypothetical protein